MPMTYFFAMTVFCFRGQVLLLVLLLQFPEFTIFFHFTEKRHFRKNFNAVQIISLFVLLLWKCQHQNYIDIYGSDATAYHGTVHTVIHLPMYFQKCFHFCCFKVKPQPFKHLYSTSKVTSTLLNCFVLQILCSKTKQLRSVLVTLLVLDNC